MVTIGPGGTTALLIVNGTGLCHRRRMPKRWIVTYTGDVFDRINGADQDQFSSLLKAEARNKPTKEVEADEMSVNGGALVFKSGGEVTTVFSPTSYWLVELDKSFTAGKAAESP
jgi:hypothetical protein